MAAVEIDVGDDEDLIRIYTRYPNQIKIFEKLLPQDFCRNMHAHSGISLWRLKYISHEEAMKGMNAGDKLKGTAITKAKVLKDLGFRFFGKSSDDPHLSVRCPACNLNVNYGKELCETKDKADCSFNLYAAYSFAKTLSQKDIFQIERIVS